MKFAPMAIPAMALLQQHDAGRDILIESAARRRAAIEARGHSELGSFGTGGVRNWGRSRAVKTNRLALSVCLSVCLYVTLVYCGQTVGWIKTKLGMEIGLGPGHVLLDGDPAPPPKRHSPPNFRPMSIVAKHLHR